MSIQRKPVLSGGCQCGAVRYALYAVPESVSICHCRMCQKADRIAKMETFQHPDHDTPDDWTPKGVAEG